MKHEKISIKWKIFFYLLVFTGILLTVLWLVQICYLDKFYKKIKSQEALELTSESDCGLHRAIPRTLKNRSMRWRRRIT